MRTALSGAGGGRAIRWAGTHRRGPGRHDQGPRGSCWRARPFSPPALRLRRGSSCPAPCSLAQPRPAKSSNRVQHRKPRLKGSAPGTVNVGGGLPLCTEKPHSLQVSAERVPISFKDEVPQGEDRLRRVCQTCGFIDYVNPRIVTGVVALKGDHILLCRRALDPRKG